MSQWTVAALTLTTALLCASQPAFASNGIKVLRASYGTPSAGKTCDARAALERACGGKPQCTVRAANNLCGDPDVGVAKELTLTWTCGAGGNEVTTRLTEHGNEQNLRCSFAMHQFALPGPNDCRASVGDFLFTCDGGVPSMRCTQLLETADPNTWQDNFLCAAEDLGVRWSSAGPIAGMRCTQILEGADPHTWDDNYLCVPHGTRLQLGWSSAGRLAGQECVQWREPADPHTWDDNYLCWTAGAWKRTQGSCRGTGWDTNGWPRHVGYKTDVECRAACEATAGCTAFDLARPQGDKHDCWLFGHDQVAGDGSADVCYAR
jgi:hypothetical protein